MIVHKGNKGIWSKQAQQQKGKNINDFVFTNTGLVWLKETETPIECCLKLHIILEQNLKQNSNTYNKTMVSAKNVCLEPSYQYDSCVIIILVAATLPGMWERTVTIGSAGKTFSVTGWKVHVQYDNNNYQ